MLSADDELNLDIYEGVSSGDYEKQFLPVEILTASISLVGRLVSELVQELKVESFSSNRDQNPPVR